MATVYKRATSYASLISLVSSSDASLSAGNQTYTSDAGGRVVVNFPAMPETLELARQANYENIVQTPITPNGFHLYRHTDPLKIPLKFSLSSNDQDYCGNDGAYALLRIAANLHALTMPILGAGGANAKLGPAPTPNTDTKPVGTPEQQLLADSAVQLSGYGNFYFPPACLLSITLASVSGQNALGIFCKGFVERVVTTLRGPWLQGDFKQATTLRNLPSFVDCEFVFVSQPGYTNNFNSWNLGGPTNIVTTTADDIYQNFYNDIANVTQPAVTYANLKGSTN